MATQHELVNAKVQEDLALGRVNPEEWTPEYLNKKGFGDCIDCGECVLVCPMGIDIRNGTQLECINCTVCIDACDTVMEKIGKPKGLIRYSTYNAVKDEKPTNMFDTRSIAYTIILTIIISVFTTLLVMRSETETLVLRQSGTLYQELQNGWYSNIYTVKILNKTLLDKSVEIRLLEPADGELQNLATPEILPGFEYIQGRLLVKLPKSAMQGTSTDIKFGIFDENGELIETTTSGFIGP
jgi:cytochrome c oxidase accessory protein FixG